MALIEQLPGVSLVVTNAVITADTDPATSVSPIPTIPVSTDQVSCTAGPQTTSHTSLIRRTDGLEVPVVQGQDPSRPQQENEFNVPWELRAISQPKTENPQPTLDQLNYVYLSPAGEGTWVYMIDSGVDRNHDVRMLPSTWNYHQDVPPSPRFFSFILDLASCHYRSRYFSDHSDFLL